MEAVAPGNAIQFHCWNNGIHNDTGRTCDPFQVVAHTLLVTTRQRMTQSATHLIVTGNS